MLDAENLPNATEGATTETTAQEAAPQITDLDGLSEFSFQGQKFTPDALLRVLNEHKTYSETAKQRAEREEFDANFEVDRVTLLKNPSLADQFRQKYPKEYHWILDFLPKSNAQTSASPTAAPSTALPPEVLEKLSNLEARVAHYDQQAHQAAVEKATAEIDKITEPLFKKFPMADDSAVFAKADALLQAGHKLTEKTWERLIRENHEAAQKRWDQSQGALLKEQVNKGRRAQDAGPGGASPGQAPVRPKTLAEAEQMLLKHVQSQGA